MIELEGGEAEMRDLIRDMKIRDEIIRRTQLRGDKRRGEERREEERRRGEERRREERMVMRKEGEEEERGECKCASRASLHY